MSQTVSLQRRIQELKKLQADLPEVLYQVQKEATQRAVKAAQAATPPKEGTGRGPYIGVGTVTGELKAHWASDSRIEPIGGALSGGSTYVTILANDMEYASYVDQGHRLERHFVPGLYIDPESGLLSYDPARKTGIVVGTRTKYVKGEFMVDKAKAAYEQACLELLDKEIGRLMK